MWTPIDNILIEKPETAQNVAATASYKPSGLGRVVGYECTVTPPLPPHFNINISTSGVTLSAPNLMGFFEPIEIKLKDLATDQLYSFKRWGDVPKGLKVVKFIPATGRKEFTASIKVTFIPVDEQTQLEGEPMTLTKDYLFIITPDYTAGHQELVRYASSSNTGGQ